MDGVSDAAFRFITSKYGEPDIMYTEFVNVMGLCIAGYNTLKELAYDEIERPVIGQIYGKDPEYFYHAAKIICALGFDGVDINMGCPAKNVTQSGSGAALIKTPDLAREIIAAVKKGVEDWVENGELTGINDKTLQAVEAEVEKHGLTEKNKVDRKSIPTSVKTRIGYAEPVTESWIQNLDKADPAWIAVHGRTLKQMYTGLADRNELKKAVNSTDKAVLINGDLENREVALEAIDETGAFGGLIGRGTFGNPWAFNKVAKEVSFEDRVKVMIEHTEKFIELSPDPRAFFQMRKHFGWYMKGFDGAKELRIKLLTSSSLVEVKEILYN